MQPGNQPIFSLYLTLFCRGLFFVLSTRYFRMSSITANLAADTFALLEHECKAPENKGGFSALKFGKTHKAMCESLSTDNPVDLTLYQLTNCYMGRSGLIHSGGESLGKGHQEAGIKMFIVNEWTRGQSLILGRKAFQRPFTEGVAMLNAMKDVYLGSSVGLA